MIGANHKGCNTNSVWLKPLLLTTSLQLPCFGLQIYHGDSFQNLFKILIGHRRKVNNVTAFSECQSCNQELYLVFSRLSAVTSQNIWITTQLMRHKCVYNKQQGAREVVYRANPLPVTPACHRSTSPCPRSHSLLMVWKSRKDDLLFAPAPPWVTQSNCLAPNFTGPSPAVVTIWGMT